MRRSSPSWKKEHQHSLLIYVIKNKWQRRAATQVRVIQEKCRKKKWIPRRWYITESYLHTIRWTVTAATLTSFKTNQPDFSLSDLNIFEYLKQTVTVNSFVVFGELVSDGWAVFKRSWPPPSQSWVADVFWKQIEHPCSALPSLSHMYSFWIFFHIKELGLTLLAVCCNINEAPFFNACKPM